ncbi:MAG TPA: RDD family protein [Candidatus Dormibacteraeota bacterium]|nr:RDD family protein [Candidatus Dormibacteraeota bacterium]
MLRVTDGQVSVEDSAASQRATTGSELRDGYLEGIRELTYGLVRARGSSLWVGPVELLRFGEAQVTGSAVDWPIEGGIVARSAGGHFRIVSSGGRLVASVEGYLPRLPLPLYAVTQLPIHHVLMRLVLLRVRGREPIPGVAATTRDRRRAAAVDIAFCITLASLFGRRPRPRVLLGIGAAYHVACWSISGRTLGGLVVGQRVISVDGSRPTVGQAVVRLLTVPLGWFRGPIHDELAGTDVIADAAP